MAIHQTHKQTDLEKRLKILRQQVYGKSSEKSVSQYISESEKSDTPTHRNTDTLISSDITYLRHDLLKISLLTSLVFGIQLIIFYLLQNNLLKLNFL